jgi:hypothetical protein
MTLAREVVEKFSKKEKSSTWPMGIWFVTLLQKRILTHIKVETKKVY